MSTTEAPILPDVREIVAVHSAKGGVGKSTTAANLAVTLARLGMDVGLLDADIYGPSVAHLLGDVGQPLASSKVEKALPLKRHGVKFLSMTNVTADDAPVIWRGPMVMSALNELLRMVDWGDLDLLIVDMPPGTGDVVLGIGQTVPISGVVTVTTPQEVSLADTRRGIHGFEQLQVPSLGLVENMSTFVCDECGDVAPLFGEGGGERTATALGLPFLGRLPIDPRIRAGSDAGTPVSAQGDSPATRAYETIARAMLAQLTIQGRAGTGDFDLTWQKMKGEQLTPPGGGTTGAAPADRPTDLWQVAGDRLGVRWGDGAITIHGTYDLRRACPCARCVDEWTRQELPSLDAIPKDVHPVTIKSVGRYAIQPVWSDGHRSGIFAWRDLKQGLATRRD